MSDILEFVCIALEVRLRCAVPRPFVRRPILDARLATHHAIPFEQRLPHFPAPRPAELAALETRSFQSLRPPPRSPRTQFPAPPSPLLSPRQRQSAHRKLPYEYSLPTSLPSTPVLPLPATPPRSLAYDLTQHRNRLDSIICVDSPMRVENPQRPASPLHSPLFISRLNSKNPQRPASYVSCLIPQNRQVPASPLHSPSFISRLNSGPPRSPLAIAASPAPASPGILDWPQERRTPEMLADLTRMEPVLPIRLPSPGPVPTWPQSQTIASEEPRMCPEILALPPAPARNPLAQPQRPPVRRCPSLPTFVATPLSAVPEVPEVLPSSGVTSASGVTRKTSKKKKRHSLVVNPSPSLLGSPIISEATLSAEILPKGLSSSHERAELDGETAEPNVNSTTVKEDHSGRVPFSDVHNTATIQKQDIFDLPVFDASQLCPPPNINLAALISPVKASRHVDRGPNPVYHYHPEAPAVAIAKSIARPAQDDFKDFSAALGAKFELKGWPETGPNELAPRVKKKKNKKKKVVANGRVQPKASVSLALHRTAAPRVLSPTTKLLPAFEETIRADPFLHSARPTTPESSRFVIDLTSPDRGLASGERMNAGCHPDCADIYCGDCE
ncbi:hypothetical protein B0H11DRAFT_2069671 [Mycena galericulata]|nr:hypothetical protein B0H11DRAFT_2069671 [Mycena galericulata]